jgi:hypothetical protein
VTSCLGFFERMQVGRRIHTTFKTRACVTIRLTSSANPFSVSERLITQSLLFATLASASRKISWTSGLLCRLEYPSAVHESITSGQAMTIFKGSLQCHCHNLALCRAHRSICPECTLMNLATAADGEHQIGTVSNMAVVEGHQI